MTSLMSQPVFQLYALSSALLIVNLFGLGFITALVRNKRKLVVNHEDAAINGGAKVGESDHADVLRVKRAHMNAIETSLPFFVIAFLYSQLEPRVSTAALLYFGFLVSRILHAVFYLKAIQPFRTLAFFLGLVINLTMVAKVIIAALQGLSA